MVVTRERHPPSTMVKLEMDVDPVTMIVKPQQAIQEFSLILLGKRQQLLDSLKGMEWNNSTTHGKIVDCSANSITVELPNKEKKELQMTGPRLRQLILAATTRK